MTAGGADPGERTGDKAAGSASQSARVGGSVLSALRYVSTA